MKTFKFTSKGSIPEHCKHVVDIDSMEPIIIWRLINRYNLTLNKQQFKIIMTEFESFIEQQWELNQKEENIIFHYSSIDMEAELLFLFEFNKFGEIKEN